MNVDLRAARAYVIARLQESSTWRGLIKIATVLGAVAKPDQWEAIILAGTMIAGIVGVLYPDRKV